MSKTVQEIMTTRVIWVTKDATLRRIRHVQGVVAVRDRLDYPPPPEGSRDRYDVLANFPMD